MVVEEGQGDGIKINEKAYVQYSGYFTDGKKFDSSYDNGGKSFDFILGRKRVIAGWEKGVLGMKVGEKRRINVPYALAYGEKGRAPIPPKSDLVFDVLLEEIENMNYPQFDLAGKDTITLPSGIKYILAEQTQGKKVVPHDTVVIKYVGKFMDGTVFDASYDRNDTLVFEVASKMVIKGLDEGLLFLKEGEKARFIIPYEMAYGEEGREPIIPAKSDLIFDIYLQKVIDGKKGF
jgi:peptidylprolyl isomerase